MKLYVTGQDGNRIYINVLASTRQELANRIGSPWFIVHGQTFHVNNVRAQTSGSNTASGAVVGGLIGILAGPIGILAGSILGGAIGNGSDKTENAQIMYFENSRIG